MRFGDIDDQERYSVAVLLIEFVEGGNLPPERRSGITAKDEHDRLPGGQRGQLNLVGLVQLYQ